MINAVEDDKKILLNLKDTGCDSSDIELFFNYQKKGLLKRQLQLLADHKKNLLQCVHENQKRIDCLDFLVYQLKKRESVKNE